MVEIQMTRAQFLERKEKFIHGVAVDIVQSLQRRCPVDTARLRNSIRWEVDGNDIVIIMLDYALHVEFGTLPHIIRPRLKKALKFQIGKETVFAKVVYHPGTKPQPFIRETFRLDLPRIISENAYRHFKGQ